MFKFYKKCVKLSVVGFEMSNELVKQNFVRVYLDYYQLIFGETLPAAGSL